MKIQLILIVFLLFLGSFSVEAQNLLDALKQTAEMHNEAHGQSTEEAPNLSDEERQQLEDYWKEKTKDGMEFINSLNKPNHQCLALIGLFNYHLFTLEQAADEEQNCKMKYDYLGLQSLMITGGLTFMPCAEKIYNLPVMERRQLVTEFHKSLYTCGNNGYVWTPLAEKAPRIVLQILIGFAHNEARRCSTQYEIHTDNLQWLLNYFFEPKKYVERILEIQRKMEALGCGG